MEKNKDEYKDINDLSVSLVFPKLGHILELPTDLTMAYAKPQTESLEKLLEKNVKGEDLAEIKRILYGKDLQ
jgi:hypothetical protein